MNSSSPFYNDNNITPPITPSKPPKTPLKRQNKELSPINVQAASAYFREQWTFRNSPPETQDETMIDGLETPPLSSATTSCDLSTPFDAIHPLFSHLSLGTPSSEYGGAADSPFFNRPGDLWLTPPTPLMSDNCLAFSQPTSSSALQEYPVPSNNPQYQYAAQSDVLHFSEATSTEDPASSPSTPSSTPKKRARKGHSPRNIVLGGSPRKTPTGRLRISEPPSSASNGIPFTVFGGSRSHTALAASGDVFSASRRPLPHGQVDTPVGVLQTIPENTRRPFGSTAEYAELLLSELST